MKKIYENSSFFIILIANSPKLWRDKAIWKMDSYLKITYSGIQKIFFIKFKYFYVEIFV